MSEEYRLETLLKLRQRAREGAEQQLVIKQQAESKARNQAEIAETLRDEQVQRIQTAREELYDGDQVTISLLQQRDAVIQSQQIELETLESKLEAAKEAFKQAQRETVTARDELTQARQEEEALNKHKENWEKEQKVVRDRRAEDAADDVAQTTWRNRKK